MTELLLANWKTVAIAVLSALVYTFFALWQNEKLAYTAYVAQITQQTVDYEAEDAKQARIHLQNLEVLRSQYEIKVPEIRASAVANYLARVRQQSHQSAPMPGTGSGVRMDDAAEWECVLDSSTIENAAEDALKLNTWQEYARLNHLPVE